MIVRETETFAKWLKALKDSIARRQINSRIARIASTDHFGDHASVGEGEAQWESYMASSSDDRDVRPVSR